QCHAGCPPAPHPLVRLRSDLVPGAVARPRAVEPRRLVLRGFDHQSLCPGPRLAPSGLGRREYGLDHETGVEGLVRLQTLLAEKPPPNVVVILEGANDIGFHLMGDPNYPLGGYGASFNVRAMAAAVWAAGAVPVTALPVGTISPRLFPFARHFILAFRREYRTLGAPLRDQNPNVHFRLRYIDEFATVGFSIHESDLGSMVLSRRVVVVVEWLLRRGTVTTTTTLPTVTSSTTSA